MGIEIELLYMSFYFGATILALIFSRIGMPIGCMVLGLTSTYLLVDAIEVFGEPFLLVPIMFVVLQWLIAIRSIR